MEPITTKEILKLLEEKRPVVLSELADVVKKHKGDLEMLKHYISELHTEGLVELLNSNKEKEKYLLFDYWNEPDSYSVKFMGYEKYTYEFLRNNMAEIVRTPDSDEDYVEYYLGMSGFTTKDCSESSRTRALLSTYFSNQLLQNIISNESNEEYFYKDTDDREWLKYEKSLKKYLKYYGPFEQFEPAQLSCLFDENGKGENLSGWWPKGTPKESRLALLTAKLISKSTKNGIPHIWVDVNISLIFQQNKAYVCRLEIHDN